MPMEFYWTSIDFFFEISFDKFKDFHLNVYLLISNIFEILLFGNSFNNGDSTIKHLSLKWLKFCQLWQKKNRQIV